jgi:uroporphyrin-III C-methyltransferase
MKTEGRKSRPTTRDPRPTHFSGKHGKVWMIGAGPGDPELLTLKAARALSEADVVLVDDLVDRRALAHARLGARIVEVGKRGGCKSTPQAFIEKLMVRLARRGAIVARLKGGDPFVFGRGGEELVALRKAGIEVEVVSGITAGIAVPAALGIPVTHRGLARGAIFVTGHAAGVDEPNWEQLARCGLTLVVYMGVARLASISTRLQEGGLPGNTPAAVIQNGTLPDERSSLSTLAELPSAAQDFGSPAIVVIGAVARLAGVAREARRLAHAA